jgi:hypothetical protein
MLMGPLGYLYLAARYRGAEVPGIHRVLLVASPILYAVTLVATQLMDAGYIDNVLDQLPLSSDQAEDRLQDEREDTPYLVASGLRFAGQIGIAAAFVLTALHARRTGLLSSFMGILGIIVGALFVLPLLGPLPVVQFFWLVAVGMLILGRWPPGRGPAWETGEPDPWPTAAELRADAQAEADESAATRRGEPEPLDDDESLEEEEAAEDDEPAAPAHPRSKKRKRKRRH